ncbi:hypothetical protein Tco_0227827, partial [Tanacetum coccineum]
KRETLLDSEESEAKVPENKKERRVSLVSGCDPRPSSDVRVSLVRVIWEDMMSSGSGSSEKVYIHPLFILSYRCTPFRYLENIVEESGAADVIVPKFDMHCHESKMTGKYVKLLARKYNIPLDLHPCAPTEGWTMDELPEDHIGLCEQSFEFSGLRVPFSTLLLGDVQSLTERVIYLRPVPSGLLFGAGLATTWEFPGYLPVFKYTKGNVVTMSEYLLFPFLSGASITRGALVPANHPEGQNTTPLLLADQPIPDKTDSQLEVETEDAKVVAAREKKKTQAAKAAAKNKDIRKRKDGAEGSSRARKKRVSEVAPVSQVAQRQYEDEETHAANDEGNSASPRGSANEYVHHFTDIEENQGEESLPRMDPLVNLSGQPTHPPKEPVFAIGVNVGGSSRLPNTLLSGDPQPQPRTILTGRYVEEGEPSQNATVYVPSWNIPRRCRVDTPEWCRELMTHLAPPSAQEESNALTN